MPAAGQVTGSIRESDNIDCNLFLFFCKALYVTRPEIQFAYVGISPFWKRGYFWQPHQADVVELGSGKDDSTVKALAFCVWIFGDWSSIDPEDRS